MTRAVSPDDVPDFFGPPVALYHLCCSLHGSWSDPDCPGCPSPEAEPEHYAHIARRRASYLRGAS